MDLLTAKTTLDYPLYACDFDPADASRLVVGGGGGASRTGVGNKITLLSTSSPQNPEVPTAAEVELAGDEDSVTCLVAGPRRGRTTIAYAGVNGSLEALRKGNNQHFRVFGIDGTAASAKSGSGSTKITELARTAFFSSPTPDPDMYQRVVRVSAPFPDGQGSTLPQIGACATGMAKDVPQIVVFDVTCAAPAAAATATASAKTATIPRVRGRLELTREAADLDIVQSGPDQYQLAYCTDHQLFLVDISTAPTGKSARASVSSSGSGSSSVRVPADPYLAYDIPLDTASGATARPVFRAIRYVTPRFVLALCNIPRRTGAFLLVLRLPDIPPPAELAAAAEAATATAPASTTPAPPNGAKFPPTARITASVRLPARTVSQGTGLAVRNLAPPATPGARQGDGTQFVVAVAGACSGPAGNTLSLYTLEYQSASGGSVELLAKLYPFRVLRDVHELPMTSIALSPVPPPPPPSSTPSAASPGIPYLRLASVSVQNSVVVHYIPLRKLPPATASSGGSGAAAAAAAAVSGGTGKPPPRYVVALKSRAPSGTGLYISVAVMVVVLALLAQSLLEIRALTRPVLGVRAVAPAAWQAPLPTQWRSISGEVYDVVDASVDHAGISNADAAGDEVDTAAVGDTAAGGGTAAGGDASVFEAFLASAAAKDGEDEGEDKKTVLVLQKQPQTESSADAEVEDASGASHTIAAVVHDEAVHGPAARWDELDPAQQQAWLQRLQDAGHWTEQMGEAVLRGVLFGELAGVVGAMVV